MAVKHAGDLYCSSSCEVKNRSETKKAQRPAKMCARTGCAGEVSGNAAAIYCSKACHTEVSNLEGLPRQYGLTVVGLALLDTELGNSCWICAKPFDSVKTIHTDHDHATKRGDTGHVRGRICGKCNTGLGALDNLAWRKAADTYLAGRAYLEAPPRSELVGVPQSIRKFGLTTQQYEDLATAADNKCRICSKPESSKSRYGSVRRLCIDHDHSQGLRPEAVRGLLCNNCNTRLHYLENPAWLSKGQKYLVWGPVLVDMVLAAHPEGVYVPKRVRSK